MASHVGAFRSDRCRARFLRALDVLMADWPDHDDHRVQTSFGSTAATITRHSGSGTPIVLLQGGGSTIAVWARFAEAWRCDRPVVAIDTVWDAGRSFQTRPVLDGASAAVWLDETLAGLGIEQAHIVGYSYGAWVALNHAVEAPSRLRSVTAIEPPGTITGMPLRAWWMMARMLFGGERQYRAYLRWVRGGRIPDSAMLEVLLSARFDFAQRGSPRPRLLTPPQWQSIRTPLAIVLGGQSGMSRASAASAVVHREAPQADLTVVPSASHAVLVDAPECVIETVRRFVDVHDRSRR